MKAYVAPIPLSLSKSIHRLADALTRYAPPDIEIVRAPVDADLVLCHMIGQEGWTDGWLPVFASRGQRYAVWQHCLISSRHPHPYDWARIWLDAAVVASCYDLAGKWRDARSATDDAMLASHHMTPNFARIPLGVDAAFRPDPTAAMYRYLVATSGYVAGTECVGEWGLVCNMAHRRQFHLGPVLAGLAIEHDTLNHISDEALASAYTRAEFVSGLRRSEGFELPAYEGLACGARPVMFDREDARHWLGEHAEYIREGAFEEVVVQLAGIVARGLRPVLKDEIRWVQETFTWQRTAERFWAAVSR